MPTIFDDLLKQAPALRDELRKYDTVTDAEAEANEALAATTEALTAARIALAETKSELGKAQAKNQRDYQQAIFDRRKELETVTAAVEDAKNKHKALTNQTAHVQARHAEIEASIESLRRRARA
jgi:predicted  nucleic acid-binding Zn-ribbon protein